MTLSSNGRRGKLRTTWNVRPTPMRHTWCTLRPSIGCAGERRAAFVRRQHAVQHVEQRGLAGAVRADDAEDLAARRRRSSPGSPRAGRRRSATDLCTCSSRRRSSSPRHRPRGRHRRAGRAGGGGRASARRNQRSRMVQNNPSGAARMITMIAAPYTTPWMPGRMLPSCAFSDSASGTRIGGTDHRTPDRGHAAEQRDHHGLRRHQQAEHRIRRDAPAARRHTDRRRRRRSRRR